VSGAHRHIASGSRTRSCAALRTPRAGQPDRTGSAARGQRDLHGARIAATLRRIDAAADERRGLARSSVMFP